MFDAGLFQVLSLFLRCCIDINRGIYAFDIYEANDGIASNNSAHICRLFPSTKGALPMTFRETLDRYLLCMI